MTNLYFPGFTFEIRIETAVRHFARADARNSLLFFRVHGAITERVATRTSFVSDCYGSGMAAFISIIGA